MQNGHAIVIGSSMGGLLAARVLSERFERVTLIERDLFPATGENRKGVPQGRHTHGLLASGGAVLDNLFPDLMTSLAAAGAVPCDPVRDGYWFNERAPLCTPDSGLRGLLASRPLIEGLVRERVLAIPNVLALQNTVVDGLLSTQAGQVGGVRIGNRVIESDLVVDASGRGSKSPQWLQEMGFEAPREERVEIALHYATRYFRRDPRANIASAGGKLLAVVPPEPLGKRGGVMLAQEGDRWTVTLVSHFRTPPPLDLPGFLDYASQLPSPVIFETIRDAEPLSEGIPAQMPASVRRRYEDLKRFPSGFLTFGDSICSFNPIYGQGMSVAALEAVALRDVFAAGGHLEAREFYRRASKIVDIPWNIAVGNDLRMPETVGPRSAASSFINWYVSRLHRAAHRDAACAIAFHRVANLLDPPEAMMRPGILWRVLRGGSPGTSAQSPLTYSHESM